ncbi:MAG: hypothetical protein ACLT8E_08715 [Akkermansia sp.]
MAELLNHRAATGKTTPFIPRDLALYVIHPENARLVEEGTLSVPGYRLWSRPGAEEEKDAEKEYLFLGTPPSSPGITPSPHAPIWIIQGIWTSFGMKKRTGT